MRARALIAGLALLGSACWSPPPVGARRTPVESLQRPLAPDLTTAAFAARTRQLAASLARLAAEPARITKASAAPGRLLGGELARAHALPGTASSLLDGELRRGAELQGDATGVVARVALPAGDRTRHTAALARLLGTDRPPLGEIDDRHHRTDPDDDRPEASLWQRLVRRLRL